MRIYYASIDSANNIELPGSKVWYNNLYLSLAKRHEVLKTQYSIQEQHIRCVYNIYKSREKDRKNFSDMLFQEIKKQNSLKKIDLFFSYFWNYSILPEVIDEIRKLGIITVNFYCNNIHQFDLVSEIAPHYDYCMFPEREALQKYIDVGANPVHIQMAANPDFYKPYNLKREYDVTFVGQNYLFRQNYAEYLYKKGIDIHVWGPGWERVLRPNNVGLVNRIKSKIGLNKPILPNTNVNGPLTDDELVKNYSRSKISLNFSEVTVQDKNENFGKLKRHIRLRDFEASMSGAFYMTGYQEELKEYYEIGKEIICYETKEDLLDKVRYYLKHQDEAETIRMAGHKRALKDHTWENRFKELFRKIGLNYE